MYDPITLNGVDKDSLATAFPKVYAALNDLYSALGDDGSNEGSNLTGSTALGAILTAGLQTLLDAKAADSHAHDGEDVAAWLNDHLGNTDWQTGGGGGAVSVGGSLVLDLFVDDAANTIDVFTNHLGVLYRMVAAVEPSTAELEADGTPLVLTETSAAGIDVSDEPPGVSTLWVTLKHSSGRFTPVVGDAITVPATLSNAAGAATGETTADYGCDTNLTGEGTLAGGLWPAASDPTDQEVLDGTGAAYHVSEADPADGDFDQFATGLTEGTAYKAHFVHEVGTERTRLTGAEFSTDAAAGTGPELVAEKTVALTNLSSVNTLSLVDLGAIAGDLIEITLFSDQEHTTLAGTQGYSSILSKSYISSTALEIVRKFMGGTPDTSVDITTSTRQVGAIVRAWRGVHADVLDGSVVTKLDGAAGAPIDPPAQTTAVANSMRVVTGVVRDSSTAGYSAPSGFTGLIERAVGVDSTGAVGVSARATAPESVPGELDPGAFGGITPSTLWGAVHYALKAA